MNHGNSWFRGRGVRKVSDNVLSFYWERYLLIQDAAAPIARQLYYSISAKAEPIVLRSRVESWIHDVKVDTLDVICRLTEILRTLPLRYCKDLLVCIVFREPGPDRWNSGYYKSRLWQWPDIVSIQQRRGNERRRALLKGKDDPENSRLRGGAQAVRNEWGP